MLNVAGNGAALVTIDVGNQTVQESGFGPVSFSGVGAINVNAAGADFNVLGTAGNDNIGYTPTGADAGTLTLAGLNATFNLSSVGNLSLDALGGTNSVTVNGTADSDTITVRPAAQHDGSGRRLAGRRLGQRRHPGTGNPRRTGQ